MGRTGTGRMYNVHYCITVWLRGKQTKFCMIIVNGGVLWEGVLGALFSGANPDWQHATAHATPLLYDALLMLNFVWVSHTFIYDRKWGGWDSISFFFSLLFCLYGIWPMPSPLFVWGLWRMIMMTINIEVWIVTLEVKSRWLFGVSNLLKRLHWILAI